MRILIANYRYFISGGPERYMFNVKELLEANGHTVIPFSIQHKQNVPSDYSSYWLSPVGDGTVTYAHEYKKDLTTFLKVFSRMTYSFEAAEKFKKLLKDVEPDLIYILHYKNSMSPSIINVAYKLKIPIVNRISDFGLICSNNVFYRYDTNEICEDCLKHNKLHAIKNKCVKNSRIYSIAKVCSNYIAEILNVNRKITAYVIPSLFTIGKLAQYGIQKEKLFYIPSFFNFNSVNVSDVQYNDFALYVGRIDPDKGLLTLVNSFINTSYNLKIIGFSGSDYDVYLRDYIRDKKHNIEFLGRMDFNEIQKYLSQCLFTIQPSDWFDNMPNTILESYAFSKAVVATRIGSLIEMVDDNQTGFHFNYKDSGDLLKKIKILFSNKSLAEEMGLNGYQKLNNSFSMQSHYNKLINLFEKVINA